MKNVINSSTTVMRCKHCRKNFLITSDGERRAFSSNIKSFNWGAFALMSWLGFWNRKPWLFIICVLFGIMFSLIVYGLVMAIDGDYEIWTLPLRLAVPSH
jgi:hypothetical protein